LGTDHVQTFNFENTKQFIKFDQVKHELKKKLINFSFKSRYHPNVMKIFNTEMQNRGGAKWTYKVGDIGTDECFALDFGKYYTSILMNLTKIPVLNSFDQFIYFEDYKEARKHKIEDLNIYCVDSCTDYNTYLNANFQLVYGFNLKEYKGKFRITSYLKPSTLHENPFNEIIKSVYDVKELDESMKKFIINYVIGLTGKKKKIARFSGLYMKYNEAIHAQECYGGKIQPIPAQQLPDKIIKELNYKTTVEEYIKLTKGYKKVYLIVKEESKTLKEGFYPIQHLIYDIARFQLFKLENELKEQGCKVLAVNTDCVYVDKFDVNNHKLSFSFQDKEKDTFFNIGKLKITKEIIPLYK